MKWDKLLDGIWRVGSFNWAGQANPLGSNCFKAEA